MTNVLKGGEIVSHPEDLCHSSVYWAQAVAILHNSLVKKDSIHRSCSCVKMATKDSAEDCAEERVAISENVESLNNLTDQRSAVDRHDEREELMTRRRVHEEGRVTSVDADVDNETNDNSGEVLGGLPCEYFSISSKESTPRSKEEAENENSWIDDSEICGGYMLNALYSSSNTVEAACVTIGAAASSTDEQAASAADQE